MTKYEYSVSLIYEELNIDYATKLEESLLYEIQNYIAAKICDYFTSAFNILHNRIEKMIEGPKVVVFFGSIDSLLSKNCLDLLKEAIDSGIFIIPVINKQEDFNKHIPDFLKSVNAFYWKNKKSPEKYLTRKIFENLGIEEKSRRIFISYRRFDGLGMADQLFDILTRQRFNTFLDKYDVEIGYDVQQEIYESLEDKTFLLVIESPDAKESQWISKEIIYALNHEIPVLILSWCGENEEISETIGLPKTKLDVDKDLVNDGKFYLIKEKNIESIISKIETFHAYGLNQRRNDFMRSIEFNCAPRYNQYVYLQNWIIYFTDSKDMSPDALVTITPRVPKAADLYYLEKISQKIINLKDDTSKILYHKSENIPKFHKQVLKWILLGKKNTNILAY